MADPLRNPLHQAMVFLRRMNTPLPLTGRPQVPVSLEVQREHARRLRLAGGLTSWRPDA